MGERWLPVSGYDAYEVSNLGRIRSSFRGRVRYLKPQRRSDGYVIVGLYAAGRKRTVYIHRIVAEAFLQVPASGLEIDHVNGDKSNNSAVNLRWVSRSENFIAAHRLGLKDQRGERNNASKATDDVIAAIRRLSGTTTQDQLAEKFGLSQSWVSRVVNNKVRQEFE